MKFAVISGSHRPDSQSGKVSRFSMARLAALDAEHECYLLELGKTPLPLWEEGIRSGDARLTEAWNPVSAALAECDGAVIVAPEWGGMVPAALKNFFLYAADGCLYHKPGLLVGVSASRGGAYPIAELRMSSYKNTHLTYIPEHVIVRNVGEVLNGETAHSEEDAAVRQRLDYGLMVLAEYSRALRQVRDSGVLDRGRFPYGM
ncbi:NADPH-dependent FMN reductase [Methylogaea oryzae]|uniref:Flavoprotein n=1 Tax=Methylogaea oryzae TaxID=1295382 RepID=A0A8D4VQE9_9GAMM|nr:NAD(P)H-dependent oxidoreductase [Methylogaea oryzae]BBL72593.1 flavoprotein [Methylogaea oryzae]